METEQIVCPACSSNKVRPYLYGLVKFKTEEDFEKAKERSVIAGCIVGEDSPAYKCDNCGNDFGNYNEVHKSK